MVSLQWSIRYPLSVVPFGLHQQERVNGSARLRFTALPQSILSPVPSKLMPAPIAPVAPPAGLPVGVPSLSFVVLSYTVASVASDIAYRATKPALVGNVAASLL